MPRNKGRQARKKKQSHSNVSKDVYEHPEEPEEDYSRNDIDGIYEYEVPDKISGDQDEEIDEDTAFNSDDEEQFGVFFSKLGNKKNENGDGSEQDYDDEENEDENYGSEEETMMLSDLLGNTPQKRIEIEENTNEIIDHDDEDEDESGDENANHDKLLSIIDDIAQKPSKKNRKIEVTESVMESEFSKGIMSNGKGLTLSSLLGNSSELEKTKKQLDSFDKSSTTLPVPLAPVQDQRISRKVAYQEKSKDMKKFDSLVRENQNRETLDFTTQIPKMPNLTSSGLSSKFKPQTSMEQQVDALLNSSGMSTKTALKDEEDELGRKKITKEEILKRQGELSKMRSLMFFEEQKRKRIKKIKSKLYHKIRNRQNKRIEDKEEEKHRELDPEYARAMDMEDAAKRAEERMTLKHTNTSKWVKHQLQRGINTDQDTRAAIAEQLQQGQQLRKKIKSMHDSDDDYSSGGDQNEDAIQRLHRKLQDEAQALVLDSEKPLQPVKGLHGMKFMQRAIEKQRELAREETERLLNELVDEKKMQNSALDDDDDEHNHKEKSKKKKKRNKKTNSSEPIPQTEHSILDRGHKARVDGVVAVDLNDNEQVLNKSNMEIQNPVKPTEFDVNRYNNEDGETNPWLCVESGKKRNNNKDKHSVSKDTMKLDVSKLLDGVEAPVPSKMISTILDKEGTSENQYNQSNLVHEAFAVAEDVEKEMEMEKDRLAEHEADVKTNKEAARLMGVAGWGSWAGDGVKPSKQSKLRKEAAEALVAEAKATALRKRKDREMSKVVLNEKKDKKVAKFTCKSVPYPFTSREEYELAMRNPLGSDWNTAASTRALTQPQVKTKAGVIIKPLKSKTQSAKRKAKF